MKTKEQKIDRLKKELIIVNDKLRFFWDNPYGISMQILDSVKREKVSLEQELKELEYERICK